MAAPILKIVYRVVVWSTFAGLVLTLALILYQAPPPTVQSDPGAAARAAQKFAAADEARAAGQTGQTVTLDGTELNSYLVQNLQLEGSPASQPNQVASSRSLGNATDAAAPSSTDPAASLNADGATVEQMRSTVKDVKVDMDGDVVKAYVVFDFHGKDLSLELDGHLGSQDGYLHFDPIAGKLGTLRLPHSVLEQAVEKMMASPENREKLRLPDDITNVQIVDGQAVISYK